MLKDETSGPFGVIIHEEDTPLLLTYLYTRFDEECDRYEEQYKNLQSQIKYVKKYLLVKTLLFPLELSVAFLLLGKTEVRARILHQRKIWKGLRAKHIDVEQINELYELC